MTKYKTTLISDNGHRIGVFQTDNGYTTVESTRKNKKQGHGRARLKRTRKKRIGAK
jgi:hypothetical protein